MAYRYGDRKQRILFPQSIDEYIPQDAPVRAYDVFVEALGFEQLGIKIEPHKVSCPQYDPKIKVVSPEELIWRIRMGHNPEETKKVIEQMSGK